MTIVEFLRARLDEAEQAQYRRRSMPDVYGKPCPICREPLDGYDFPMDGDGYELRPCQHSLSPEQMEAFAPTESRADPFVLADIAAKRGIADRSETDAEGYTGLRLAVLFLVQPYTSHGDFDAAWTPW